MSVKKQILIFIFLGGALGLSFFLNYTHKDKYSPMKPNYVPSLFASQGANAKTIQVKLKSDPIQTDNEINEVKAFVSMPFDYTGEFYYTWTIGEGVTVESGNLSGKFQNLTANEIKTLSIFVKGFSKETNHHIKFDIFTVKNNRRLLGGAFTASKPEDTFENIVQNVEKIKAEQ